MFGSLSIGSQVTGIGLILLTAEVAATVAFATANFAGGLFSLLFTGASIERLFPLGPVSTSAGGAGSVRV